MVQAGGPSGFVPSEVGRHSLAQVAIIALRILDGRMSEDARLPVPCVGTGVKRASSPRPLEVS